MSLGDLISLVPAAKTRLGSVDLIFLILGFAATIPLVIFVAALLTAGRAL